MSTNFPGGIDTTGPSGSLPVETAATPLSNNHVAAHQNVSDAVIAVQTYLGIIGSAVTSSITYLLTNVLSIDPGHKHTKNSVTLALDDLSDVIITTPVNGNGLTYNGTNWVNSSTATADASTTVKGVTKLDTAPASPTSPIAVGVNSALFTTSSGTSTGTSNKIEDQLGFQKGTEIYAADSVGTDSYAISVTPTPAAYVNGMTFRFKAGTANTGAASLNVNSIGAITIKKKGSTDLTTGDILSGQIVEVTYDGTNFQMISPQSLPFLGLFASGTTTYDLSTASGVQNIAHGLGVVPKIFNVSSMFTSGSSQANIAISINGNAISSNTASGSSFGSSQATFTAISDVSANRQVAVITADATNIILTWTKTNFPTGTAQILWSAEA